MRNALNEPAAERVATGRMEHDGAANCSGQENRAFREKRERRGLIGRNRLKRPAAALLLALALALVPLLGGCSSNGDNNAGNSASSNSTTDAGSADRSGSSNDAAPSDSGDSRSSDDSAHNDSSSAADKGSSDSDSSGSSIGKEPATDDGAVGSDGTSSQYDATKPGQLTAGEWNDNEAWKSWLNLIQAGDGQENTAYWSLYPQHRLEVDVTAGGKPVADASVTLTGEDGDTAWEARTNNKGVAYLYAGLLDEQDLQEKYGVAVSYGDQLKRYENVPVPRAQALKVELEQPVKTADALDLMLLVDTTGSMGDELKFLKTELKDVVQRVERDNGQVLHIRTSANFYRDRGDDYVVKPFDFTDDIDDTVAELSEQKAAGGGDFPEAVDQALDNAIKHHDWSDSARARLLFLVMDAPPHHERKVNERIGKLTELAAEEGIRIIPVASSGVDKPTEYLMRAIAAATGGTYLFLTDHSGIGNDHLQPDVGEYEVQALNDLLVEVINRYAAAQ